MIPPVGILDRCFRLQFISCDLFPVELRLQIVRINEALIYFDAGYTHSISCALKYSIVTCVIVCLSASVHLSQFYVGAAVGTGAQFLVLVVLQRSDAVLVASMTSCAVAVRDLTVAFILKKLTKGADRRTVIASPIKDEVRDITLDVFAVVFYVDEFAHAAASSEIKEIVERYAQHVALVLCHGDWLVRAVVSAQINCHMEAHCRRGEVELHGLAVCFDIG